jgi:uncharacterized membrane protein YdbT with pleckstrin-like domain
MHLLASETSISEIRPVPRLNKVWLLSRGLSIALLAALVSFLPWMMFNAPAQRGTPPPYGLGATVAVVATVFAISLMLAYAYLTVLAKTYSYNITDKRFVFTGGVLRKVIHAVEHRRVTDVQLSQNVAEQIFKVYSVNLFTPGTASVRPNAKNQPMPELRLEGIPNGPEVFALISESLAKARASEA